MHLLFKEKIVYKARIRVYLMHQYSVSVLLVI